MSNQLRYISPTIKGDTPLCNYPNDKIVICTICDKDHEVMTCPILHKVKVAIKNGENETTEDAYFIGQI